MASSAGHGLMWSHVYAMTPGGIYVDPESSIYLPKDLAGVEVNVGYHSGSHFATLQALEKSLKPEEINLRFGGGPNDRLANLLERKVTAIAEQVPRSYILEQQGFRKVMDTSFAVGYLITGDPDPKDVEAYFRVLKRSQQDIDLDPHPYKHYYLKELPERFHSYIKDVRAFGPGKRVVFEPYTQEMYETTHRWMISNNLFSGYQLGTVPYKTAVIA